MHLHTYNLLNYIKYKNNLNNIIPNGDLDLSKYVPLNWNEYNFIKPKPWFIKNKSRILEYENNLIKIWDCGYLIKIQ
jgi:hypothetical protein